MRLKRSDLVAVFLRKRIVGHDDELNEIITYDDGQKLMMNVQPASGQVAAELYGERLRYFANAKYVGNAIKENRNELDGICLNVASEDDPDYRIVAINTYSNHLNMTLERIKQDGESRSKRDEPTQGKA
ncbi:hypothetical protein P3T66_06580 [Latilactobacillus sakei]|uniref:hypothetical protein n=1 Tax=Latilactobacillus sakei TaxID=1599 RepID=UPI000975DADB|nr:hypothetical protein [Latilactobacillus sakei]MDM5043903.1 hypothetical protein [Latilactobacillus sakei]RXA82572.1 hypothetical protein EQ835_01915 [Latilactobacillus sakei]WEY49766.1 hypothetical protein P3T66_06580 [Latilactobacillus sakei]